MNNRTTIFLAYAQRPIEKSEIFKSENICTKYMIYKTEVPTERFPLEQVDRFTACSIVTIW